MVNVLISTYNGEKYIKEQLDSLLEQTYKDIKVWIRDDGSTDATLEIVKKYISCHKQSANIVLIEDRLGNIGYGPSFLNLLKLADEGDYWAYCDQDDVWFPEKIEVAVNWLCSQEGSYPKLFHSAYYNTDEQLNIQQLITSPPYSYDFVRSITEVIHMGFSSAFNKELRDLVLKGNPDNLITHDWWTELLVMKFGEAYYDNRPMSYHRRLNNSVSVNSMAARFGWLKRALKGNAEIRSVTKEFDRVFGIHINDKECKIVRWFCNEHYSFVVSLKKAFYPKRWRPVWSSELVVRFLMLLGKL